MQCFGTYTIAEISRLAILLYFSNLIVTWFLITPITNPYNWSFVSGLFQQAILESGSILTCFEGALGTDNNNMNVAMQYCNFTADMWNKDLANNIISLKNCMQNVDAGAFGNFTAVCK